MAEPLRRVLGTRTANLLATMGMDTVGDLIRHYPRKIVRQGTLSDLGTLAKDESVLVWARVVSSQSRRMRSRSGALLTVTITDGRHLVPVTFFASSPGALRGHEAKFQAGREGWISATVAEYQGKPQLKNATAHFVGDDMSDEDALAEASKPRPVYPATAKVSQEVLANSIRTVLDTLTVDEVADILPDEVRASRHLPTALGTLRGIHRPESEDDWYRARHALVFEEAFVLQVELARRRLHHHVESAIARPRVVGGILDEFDRRLPFELTPGQLAVGEEIASELTQAHPMHRLLQGDVGSGKTVVALRAMLQVVDAGGQAAILAPTEVLAVQHAATIRALMGPLAEEGWLGSADSATQIALLTGSLTTAQRRRALLDIASGQAGIVVGTHALIQESVTFADLGLAVVDEQHRFGVHQRDALRAKAAGNPHLLVMTATPIPRTIAMTAFGDLDVSALTDRPRGRAEVATHVVPESDERWRARIWQRMREEVVSGNRVFVVCPRIDAAEADDETTGDEQEFTPRAVDDIAAQIRAMDDVTGSGKFGVAVLHGRMTPDEKDAVMDDFVSGRSPILVATTVIEVGIDVPTATMMVVFDADRFGLAQLHQLRGRIGRGDRPGLCLLVTRTLGGPSRQRLDVIASTTDGFVLANEDLRARREGDVLGAAQSGASSSLRYLRVIDHEDVLLDARDAAIHTVAEDDTLASWPGLADALAGLDPEREEYLDRF